MGRHSIHPRDVCADELLPATASLERGLRTLRRDQLFHLDPKGQELSADGHKCGGDNPMLRRAIETFWLTTEPEDHIL